MTEFLLRWVWETWIIFKQASVFLLFGFLVAGLLAVCVPEKLLSKLFRTGKIKSVLWAATVGAPLPLCSCGVVPAALALKRQGATPGATVAFLIATPETGADSVSLTYALMDPLVTVFRPVAAVVTALTAGLLTNLFGERKHAEEHGHILQGISGSAALHAHGTAGHVHAPVAAPISGPDSSRAARAWRVLQRVNHYAFGQLLDDIGYWIVLGIVLSGLIAAALPPAFFERYLGSELVSMLVMLLVGVPIYVCASEATPLAAALVLKGLNPGAALVFLLVGPATNIGSLVPLTRFFGARIMAIYLGAIVSVALLAGFALNAIYRTWGIDPRATFGTATGLLPEWLKVTGALLLLVLLVLSMRRAPVPVEWVWLRDRFAHVSGLRIPATKLAGIATAVAAVLYAASGFIAVQPGEVGMRTRFGEIVSPALQPGLHYRMPWPFEGHRVVRKDEVQRIEFGFAG